MIITDGNQPLLIILFPNLFRVSGAFDDALYPEAIYLLVAWRLKAKDEHQTDIHFDTRRRPRHSPLFWDGPVPYMNPLCSCHTTEVY